MTEPLLCRTADGKIHWTSQCAGGGLVDSREYKTYCGQQVVSVIHEPITATDWYHNLNDEEKQHLKNVDKIMEGWDGELCPRCQNIREQEERQAWGVILMKKYLVGLTFRYIESNHETYCILDEKKYNEYKKFFCEDCKPLAESGESFGEDGEIDAEPGISIDEIQMDLENAIEMTPEVEKAVNLLRFILPSQTDALYYIKHEIVKNKYLEE